MRLRLSPILVTFILVAAGPCAAAIYTWKDEQGRTIVSDKPPGDQVKGKVRKSGEAPPPVTNQPAEESEAPKAAAPVGVDPELDKRRKDDEVRRKAEVAAKEQAAKAELASACKSVRDNLALLESGVRVATRNEKGERAIMEDDQRNAEIARARKFIADNCSQ